MVMKRELVKVSIRAGFNAGGKSSSGIYRGKRFQFGVVRYAGTGSAYGARLKRARTLHSRLMGAQI